MENQEPITTQRRISWKDRLDAMKLNDVLKVAIDSIDSARMAMYKLHEITDKKFTSKRVNGILEVTRIK